MAKEEESCGSSHTVFIKTNLNTHLVMVATDHDTVDDFKKKISMGHSGCFPDIGEITIHSLKVRRNGHFYHLLNSIPVKSAFDGVKKSWFLHVDATPSQGKATLRNIHQNLLKDVDTRNVPWQAPEILGALVEREIHDSVNEIGEGNSIPCSALGKPHKTSGAVAAIGDGNLDSLQDLDMGRASGSKLQSRVEASETTSTFEGKKKKRKKREKTPGGQPDTETELNMKDVDSSNLLVTSAAMETVDPGNKRRKKAGKNKDSDAKSHSHANDAEDIVGLISDHGKSIDTDLGTEKDSILLRTEGRQVSKVCSDDNDKIEEKSVLQNGVPKMVIEAKNMKSNIRNSDVSAIDAAVSTETRDLSDESNKKSNKSKTADSHSNSAKDIIPQTESSFDGDLGMKIHSVLSQTENKQLSIVCPHDNGNIEEKSMSENENFATVPEAKGTLSHIRGIDVSAIDAAISTEAQNPAVKKRKKFKKHKTSNAERKVSTSGAEHIEISENAIQSISKSHGPSVQDYSGTETNKGDTNFFQTEYVEVAKVVCLDMRGNGFHDKGWQGPGHEDTSIQLSTDDVGDKVNHKEKDKSKTADSHANSAKDIIPQTESSLDGDLGRKNGSDLFQTENKQLSIVCPHGNGKIEEYSMFENGNFAMVPEAKGSMSNIRVADVSPIDVAISTEVQNTTAKKGKKSKKRKDPNAERKVLTSGAKHVECSENAIQSISKSHKPSKQDYCGTETNKGDTNFSQTEYVEVAKVQSLDMRGKGFHDKGWQGAEHEDTSIQLAQVDRIQGSTDDVGNKVNHKESKPSVSTSNLVLKDQVMIEQVAHTESSPLSTKGKKEEVKASNRKRKSKLKTDDSLNELCKVGPESGAIIEFEAKSLQQQELSDRVVSPQLTSSAVNCGIAGPRIVNESRDGANDGEEVNFRNYFVSKPVSQINNPVKELVENDVHQVKHDKKLKTDKKTKPGNSNSVCTSSDLKKPHAEVENQGRKKKTMSAIPNTFQPHRSSLEPHSNDSNLSTARENVETPLDDNNKAKAFPVEVSRDKVVDSSKVIKSPHVQFHSLSSSKAPVSSKVNNGSTKEYFVEKIGDVVNGSQNQKSSLDVPKKVYSESSSESYEDKSENKEDSDASTSSPSDTSDDSDKESEVNLSSPGSFGRNITKNGGNRSAKSQRIMAVGDHNGSKVNAGGDTPITCNDTYENVCDLAMMLETTKHEEREVKGKNIAGGPVRDHGKNQTGNRYHPYDKRHDGNQHRGGFKGRNGNNQGQRASRSRRVSRSVQRAKRAAELLSCFICGRRGHSYKDCPSKITEGSAVRSLNSPRGRDRPHSHSPQKVNPVVQTYATFGTKDNSEEPRP